MTIEDEIGSSDMRRGRTFFRVASMFQTVRPAFIGTCCKGQDQVAAGDPAGRLMLFMIGTAISAIASGFVVAGSVRHSFIALATRFTAISLSAPNTSAQCLAVRAAFISEYGYARDGARTAATAADFSAGVKRPALSNCPGGLEIRVERQKCSIPARISAAL